MISGALDGKAWINLVNSRAWGDYDSEAGKWIPLRIGQGRGGIVAVVAEKISPQYIKHNQESVPGTEVFDNEGNKIRVNTATAPA